MAGLLWNRGKCTLFLLLCSFWLFSMAHTKSLPLLIGDIKHEMNLRDTELLQATAKVLAVLQETTEDIRGALASQRS